MSYLLEALRTATPLALPLGPYPTAKWPEGLTHLPKPAQLSREFHSEALGTTVRVVYELETEPLQYQHGRIATDVDLLEIWHGSWDCGSHLDAADIACVRNELVRELGL